MSKTEQPDVVFEQFEQAGPDIRMLASQVRALENPGVRDTLLRAIQVLMRKRANPPKTEDPEQNP